MDTRSAYRKILLSPLKAEKVPEQAANLFRTVSENPGPSIGPDNFEELFVSDFGEEGSTFVASHINRYPSSQTEHAVYFADLTPTGELAGRGGVRLSITDQSNFFRDKPYVSSITRTEHGYLRQGLGLRRLLVMGRTSEMLFGLPLHSDSFIDGNGRRVWQKLVEEGVAVVCEEPGCDQRRYRFLGQSALSSTQE